ncbi:HAD family phosphatase [Candidatus Woesearchaeota archaeon]|nr:HAD family phosphatase [Candidatus Woesearchaeota archaeon]HIH25823.1 HAD-IB family phosphatase [Nanoarchaeota archaeon]
MNYKLICFDIDGVIFKDVNFWMELHKSFNTLEQGKILTEKYLHSDYPRLVEEVVVNLWKGRDAKPYFDLVNSLEYLPGVKQMFDYVKSKGFISALISASSIEVARRVQKDFGVDHIFANELIIRDNKVSGEFLWPLGAGKEKKADIIRNLCNDLNISPNETIYIGDSDKDIEAFKEVGLSIAFNSNCKELKDIATFVVDSDNLSKVLKYLPK